MEPKGRRSQSKLPVMNDSDDCQARTLVSAAECGFEEPPAFLVALAPSAGFGLDPIARGSRAIRGLAPFGHDAFEAKVFRCLQEGERIGETLRVAKMRRLVVREQRFEAPLAFAKGKS